MRRLTWAQAAAWRAGRHHLAGRAPAGSVLEVARRVCGLHAQVMSSAELSLWARVEDLDRGAVQRALWEERTLVKTWAMRGTLHLLPADEVSLWHAALGASNLYRSAAPWRRFGITLDEVDRLTDAVAAALARRVMTREELAGEVARLTRSPSLGDVLGKSSWGTILKPAAFAGHLCFAPSVGQRVRFTRPDTWLPGRRSAVDPAAAASAVARRFVAAYGPATHLDLARWWSGGGMAQARRWIASLGDEVTAVEVEGTAAWMLTADVGTLRAASAARGVRLLPAFDPYVVAASPHARQLLPGDLRHLIYRPQGWISPVLLVNGRMAGTWRHEGKASRVDVVIDPFAPPATWVRRAAEEEAERLAAFLGGRPSVAWKGASRARARAR